MCQEDFCDDRSLENFDLCLYPGEVWLSTEPQKMTWLEAIEIAGMHSAIRLPHYQDIITAVEKCKSNNELCKLFPPLESGEFWAIGSENYNASCVYACCVVANHRQFESHHSKIEKKWVRFIKRGNPETDLQRKKKEEKRAKLIYEENLAQRTSKILGLDTEEGRQDLETHIKLMSGCGLGIQKPR
jgi:hypothetical protein